MRQTCESERENGGNNDAERERTSESEIEDLGAQLDKACASRPLDRAQHGMTRRTAATHLLTAVLWLVAAVILLAMLLRMLPNNLDGKRYVPLIVALMPWLGILSLIIAITAIAVRAIGGRVLLATVSVVCVVVQIGWHWVISGRSKRFPTRPAPQSRKSRPTACPTRPTGTPAS